MLRRIAFFVVLALMMTPAAAQQINVDGATIPLQCWQWHRNVDGSWSTVGVVFAGPFILNNVSLKRAKARGVLDWYCLPH